MPIGFVIPFSVTTGSLGYFETTFDEISAVRENLKSLLITNWGERPMNYRFGCNFREFLFEQQDREELRTRLADRILSQTERWLPFVIIENLNVLFSSDNVGVPDNGIGLRIGFRLTGKPDTVITPLDLTILH